MLSLESPISAFPRIHKTTVEKFSALGIQTVQDLLEHFPFRYDDFSHVVPIKTIGIGTQATFRGTVKTINNRNAWRRRLRMTEAIVSDETGSISVLWFNQPYLTHVLTTGDVILCSGKAKRISGRLTVSSPAWEKEKPEQTHVGRIVPVYTVTKGLTVKTVRTFMERALFAVPNIPERVPEELVKKHAFLPRGEAMKRIHFPERMEDLKAAKTRFTYEELLLIQIAVQKTKKLLRTLPSHAIPHDDNAIKDFLAGFPFDLTNDQRKAAWRILTDMEKPRPMNRLLQGDVGSGKTLVAEIALFSAAHSGFQGALLAPTELLARQHAERISAHMEKIGVRVGYVSGSTARVRGKTVSRATFERAVQNRELDVLIGTHALLNERILIEKLGIIVIDEQHRFGVEQRKLLREQAMKQKGVVPHFLSMTATPIPRSLSLTLYGDLDLTLIEELPTGTKRIATKVLIGEQRTEAFKKIADALAAGKQSFVVYPIIDPSDTLGVRAATEEFEELKKVFPENECGLLHGRMKAEEKQTVLDRFSRGDIHILVTTSVIEVGIDVPDASVMLIEGAERFGLAQLHQLRGRIGRAGQEAFCYLATDQTDVQAASRLRLMETITDGFTLSEKDLEIRGPGELFGTAQSGYSGEALAHLTDIRLLAAVQKDAEWLLTKDPALAKYPALKTLLQERTVATHFE